MAASPQWLCSSATAGTDLDAVAHSPARQRNFVMQVEEGAEVDEEAAAACACKSPNHDGA